MSWCDVRPITHPGVQDQYVLIRDAVLESLTCGDTQIPASSCLVGCVLTTIYQHFLSVWFHSIPMYCV